MECDVFIVCPPETCNDTILGKVCRVSLCLFSLTSGRLRLYNCVVTLILLVTLSIEQLAMAPKRKACLKKPAAKRQTDEAKTSPHSGDFSVSGGEEHTMEPFARRACLLQEYRVNTHHVLDPIFLGCTGV